MPISIGEIFSILDLEPIGPFKWGLFDSVPNSSGVYVVTIARTYPEALLDKNMIKEWIENYPEINVDKQVAKIDMLAKRISSYWLPQETIVYMGMTTRSLRKRLRQFYRHQLGNRSPHSGGQWLKILSPKTDLSVFVAESRQPQNDEDSFLRYFHEHCNQYPFANLKGPLGRRAHGIRIGCRSSVRID